MVINIKELHFTSHYNSCNINQFLLNTTKNYKSKGENKLYCEVFSVNG